MSDVVFEYSKVCLRYLSSPNPRIVVDPARQNGPSSDEPLVGLQSGAGDRRNVVITVIGTAESSVLPVHSLPASQEGEAFSKQVDGTRWPI